MKRTAPRARGALLPAFLPALCALLGSGLLGAAARANDASLDLSGSPRLMSGHPSVAMQSERIFLRVEKGSVKADCRFTFVNRGPACTVRMGFPDDSWEREASDASDGPFQTGFTSFQSYVDGRPVSTTREMSGKGGPESKRNTMWFVKSVAFGARGTKSATRRVRDVYEVPIGGEMNFLSSLAGYTLHTGSSWHGPIGRSEVEILFARPIGRSALRAYDLRSFTKKSSIFDDPAAVGRVSELLREPGTVVYQGPGRAQVLAGRSLRWVRTNWSPSEKDDIVLHFKMP